MQYGSTRKNRFNNHYPFGSIVEKRSWRGDYRYGFNGQEGDREVSGSGNSYTAEYWQYDSRLGRRWNVDPKGRIWASPFAVLGNNPIIIIDPKGDLWKNKNREQAEEKRGDVTKHENSLKELSEKKEAIKAQRGNQSFLGNVKLEIREFSVDREISKLEKKKSKAERRLVELEKRADFVDKILQDIEQTNYGLYQQVETDPSILEVDATFDPIRFRNNQGALLNYTDEGVDLFPRKFGQKGEVSAKISIYAPYSFIMDGKSQSEKANVKQVEQAAANTVHAVAHLFLELKGNNSEQNAIEFTNDYYWLFKNNFK